MLAWPVRQFKPFSARTQGCLCGRPCGRSHPQSGDCQETRVLEHSFDPAAMSTAGSNKAMDCNCVGQFEISVLGSLKLRCQELVKFSGLQRPSLFIRNDDLPSLAGPNARLGDRYQHADPLAAYFLVLSCRYNLICQPGGSSIRTSPRHLVLPLWLQFAVKVTIWGQTLVERTPAAHGTKRTIPRLLTRALQPDGPASDPKSDIRQRLNDLVVRRSCRGTATRSSQASVPV